MGLNIPKKFGTSLFKRQIFITHQKNDGFPRKRKNQEQKMRSNIYKIKKTRLNYPKAFGQHEITGKVDYHVL